jgi:polyisoprenoid-binding protein YceI
MKTSYLALMGIVSSLSFSQLAQADWSVNNEQSSVHFISVKAEHIAEIHHFKQVAGNLARNGEFSFTIDLSSVETAIDIRNTRMQEHLFKAAQFPSADISAKLPQSVMQLQIGQTEQVDLTADLTLVGKTQSIKVALQVTKTQSGGYLATSVHPILISAKDFGLTEGLDILQKLAGLPSIGHTVPVSFNLQLQ